jgi:hypothetical protein
MPNSNPHVQPLDDAQKQLQKSNNDLLSLSKSLVKVIDKKISGLDGRINTLERQVSGISERDRNKFDWGIYFRDRVLPQILTVITLAILALAFAPK